MAITKNIVTDYGANNGGVVDAAPAFYTGLKPDMAGVDIVNLTIPAGSYNIASGGGATWAGGMGVLNVTATGATLLNGVELGSLHISPVGIDEATGKSARIASVSAGSTSVTLTAASAASGYISRAVVGRWMIVVGYNIQDIFQSPFGHPPNFHFIDFVQITGIVGNTISFTPALQNTYSDQWPELNRGDAFHPDAAGPATVFFLDPVWDHTTNITGGTYNASALIKGEGRTWIMTGGTSVTYPIFPTVNQTWRAINHDASGAFLVEHDKLCDWVDVQGGTYTQWHEQSSSTRLLSLNGVTITGSLNGTPRNTTVDNCVIGSAVNIGPAAYGRGDTFICRNTSIAGTIGGGYTEKGAQTGATDPGVQGYMSMSGGVITIPKSLSASGTRIFPPDPSGRNVLFWVGNTGTVGSFRVLSVTSDPWPAVDNQTATTNVTMSSTSNKKNLGVSTNIFASGDVGKVILIPGAGNAGGTMATFITAFTDAQNVVVFDDCLTTLSVSSKQLQWGTSNIYVRTDQTGGLPAAALYNVSGKLNIQVPPARTVYFSGCTGTAHAVDLSQAGAQNRPLWTYTKRTYDGSTGATGAPSILLHGNITSIKVNVITPYTGASTLNMGFAQFDNLPVVVAGAYTTYGPRFNLKIAGERVITVGSTTGAQSLDSNLNISSATWLGQSFQPSMSRDISGESSSLWPSFTVEIITDQGFSGDPAAARVRLRMR